MAASIIDWLSDIENEPPTDILLSRPSKRKQPDDAHTSHARVNVQSRPPKKQRQRQQRPLPRMSQSQSQPRPGKRVGVRSRREPELPPPALPPPTTPTTTPAKRKPAALDHDADADADFTPRAPLRSSHSDADSVSNPPSLRSEKTSSTRGSSPHKWLRLATTTHSIQHRDYTPGEDDEIPKAALDIIQPILFRYAHGRSILPSRARGSVPTFEEDMANGLDTPAFAKADDNERDRLGDIPDLRRVQRMCTHTRDCEFRDVSEAAWNCASHDAIGREAWDDSSYREKTRWDNITTCTVDPAYLPPGVSAAKVDFAISLRQSDHTRESLQFLDTGWNPSNDKTLIHSPLAVLIETKKKGGSSTDARYQVTIWASAVFNRRVQLLQAAGHENAEMIPLPLLIVEGSSWELWIAVWDRVKGLTVWHCGDVGRANSWQGIYQIVATLQFLMRWTEEDFRPWFEKNCCPSSR